MKKLLFATALFAVCTGITETKAQVRVNLNVNIGRPAWGVPGNYAGGFYYLPEIDTYYDIAARQFVYFDGDEWAFAYELPYMYRDYDLYHGYKVVINEPRPYLHCDMYRNRYSSYYTTYQRRVYPSYRYGYDNDRSYRVRENDRFEDRRGWEDRRWRGRDRDDDDHDNGRGHAWGRRGRG